MAYQNEVFPAPALVHNIQREYVQATTIVQNGIQEYRIQKQRFGRHRWTLNEKSYNPAGLQELLDFLDAREYSLYSFYFADPLDKTGYNNTQLPWSSGSLFSLTKPGANGALTAHPIFHLDPSVTVTKNGTPTAYTKTIVNSVPYISVAGAGSGDVIRITGKYGHAVRLDQASSVTTVAALNTDNTLARAVVGQIVLTEVFES